MPLDPELVAYYERVARELPAPAQPTVEDRRERMEAIARRFPPRVDAVAREDLFIALPGRELFVRVYRPALLFFHGGGWVAGSVFTHDGPCAALAQNAGVVVVSVEYRRAPESPFPLPNDDASAALGWLVARTDALDVDVARLAIGGDSAGGHLAAALAHDARDRGIALAFQLLIYPVIEPDFETPSYLAHATGGSLTRADMIEYWGHYLGADLRTRDPRAVPSRAPSHAGLAPAHVVVAELDPLRDDGVRYAGALRAGGVATTLVEVPHVGHGFLRAAPYARVADLAQRAIAQSTARALGTAR